MIPGSMMALEDLNYLHSPATKQIKKYLKYLQYRPSPMSHPLQPAKTPVPLSIQRHELDLKTCQISKISIKLSINRSPKPMYHTRSAVTTIVPRA